MRVSRLIEHLTDLKNKYGDVEVDIITEMEYTFEELLALVKDFDTQLDAGKGSGLQVEQPLGDIAYAPSDKRVKLLPEGF
jgi:hypothetical protein